jgi:autotransporter-associated beta strand protein
MKKSRFHHFTPGSRSNSIGMLLAIAGFSATPVFAVLAPGTINTYNGNTSNGLSTGSNWDLGSPLSSSGAGVGGDLRFSTAVTGSTFTGGGGSSNMNAESYNVTNGASYTLQMNTTTYQDYRIGYTTDGTLTTETIAAFINAVSGGSKDLIYLSNGSNLTFNATNEGGGTPATMNLRQSGNLNIGNGSVLTLHTAIKQRSGGIGITIVGDGTTILTGSNLYTGTTTVRGGVLEIAGTNVASSYTINGLVNPSEPLLKLSNVNALPVTAGLTGASSVSFDGFVDLAVAGAYTFDVYNGGHLKFTASSGSTTSLHFTGVSKITSGTNLGRTLSNLSGNLSIVFDSTLDIGGDIDGTSIITGAGNTTVTGCVLSTGAGVRSLTKSGSGRLVLNDASAYTGTTTVGAGVLRLGHTTALPGGNAAIGGTSSLIFSGTTGVVGLTAASGDFLRGVGPGADQVTANPTAASGLGESMGFAAYGGDRVVDFGASVLLSSTSYAGDGLTFGAADSDSKVTLVNDINLASSTRNVTVYDGSAAVDAEISGVINSAAGSLDKRGDGTLSLTGTNTYEANTTVYAGTLAVDGDSIADSGNLVIDGGKVDLTSEETVATLFFGLVQQSAGTYSSDGAGDTIASANLTGSGTLIVTSGGGSPFTTWAETTHSLVGDDALTGADPDDDGLKNTLEFVLGGDPNANDSPSVLPSVTHGTSAITLTFNRSDESEVQPVAVKVQVSADLTTWSPADDIIIGDTDGSGPNGVTYTVAENGSAPDTVVVTIPKNSATEKFVRLETIIP